MLTSGKAGWRASRSSVLSLWLFCESYYYFKTISWRKEHSLCLNVLSVRVFHWLGLYPLGAYSFVDRRKAHLKPISRSSVGRSIGSQRLLIKYLRCSRSGRSQALEMQQSRRAESLPSRSKGAQEMGSTTGIRGPHEGSSLRDKSCGTDRWAFKWYLFCSSHLFEK